MRFLMTAASLAAASILVACSGNPAEDSGDSTPPTTDPTEVSGLGAAKVVVPAPFTATRIDYNSTTDEMIIESIPFDDDVFSGVYTRNAGLDRGGYRAYVSDNGFDNYIAYFDESATGAVKSAVVGSDEYLDHGYRGAMYARTGNVTLPSTTQRAFYNGEYVGLRTHEEGGPMETVTGDARMEVDFSDDKVRGSVINRAVVFSTDPTLATDPILTTITFTDSNLDRTNGTFSGGISTPDVDGSYTGLLADGTRNASEMAGVAVIDFEGYSETVRLSRFDKPKGSRGAWHAL